MIGPEHEAARTDESGAAGFGDAVTFAFGDPEHGLYGSARLGLVPGEPARASGLGLLFRGGELVAVDAAGGIELPGEADWSEVEAGDVRATIEQPLQTWDGRLRRRRRRLRAALRGAQRAGRARHGRRRGERRRPAAATSSCAASSGTVRCGEQRTRIDCLGQRGHQWGAPDWERIALARTVSAWFEGGSGVALTSVRPHDAAGHADEAVSASLLDGEAVTAIAEPLLSTTLDGDGRQRRASLELWEDGEDERPIRTAPPARRSAGRRSTSGGCGSTAPSSSWRMEGREGVGRYDVLRRA